MARTKKSVLSRNLAKAMARDRKRAAEKRMRVSGKGVFNLARIVGGTSGKARKKSK